MSVKITIEVHADTLSQAFAELGALETKGTATVAAVADKGSTTAKTSEQPAATKTRSSATPPGDAASKPAAAKAATAAVQPAPATAAPADTMVDDKSVHTTASLIQQASLAVNNTGWGASVEDRKAQVMAIPKKYGVNRFAELNDPVKLAAASADIGLLTTQLG